MLGNKISGYPMTLITSNESATPMTSAASTEQTSKSPIALQVQKCLSQSSIIHFSRLIKTSARPASAKNSDPLYPFSPQRALGLVCKRLREMRVILGVAG
jgi:hypothetical protein